MPKIILHKKISNLPQILRTKNSHPPRHLIHTMSQQQLPHQLITLILISKTTRHVKYMNFIADGQQYVDLFGIEE